MVGETGPRSARKRTRITLQTTPSDIVIEHVGVSNRKSFMVTRLKLTKGGESRDVFHFWFTSWPDHGVPRLNGKVHAGTVIGACPCASPFCFLPIHRVLGGLPLVFN